MLFQNAFFLVCAILSATMFARSAPVPRHERPGGVMAKRATVEIGQQVTGKGTWYHVGTGACGSTNTENEFVVAVSKHLFDGYPGATDNPNKNPICGKMINVWHGEKKTAVKVVDRCATLDPGCLLNDLDFSKAAFMKMAPLETGLIDIKWEWATECTL